MQHEFATLGIFVLFGIIFSTLPIAGAFFFRPRKGNEQKEATYECGLHPKNPAKVQVHVQYYLFALAFLIFSIEILYVYPWALNFKNLGVMAVIEMFVFLFILIMGLLYAWRKGGLEWS